MTRFRAFVPATFAALLIAVCAWTAEKPENKLSADVKNMLEKPEQFELLSLDPAVRLARFNPPPVNLPAET